MPQGDEQAQFLGLVNSYQGQLLSYCRRFLNDQSSAQEVVQEAFLRLWKAPRSLLAEGARPWLFKVCRNLCLDRLRKGKRELGMEAMPEQIDENAKANEASYFGKEVMGLLEQLPKDQKEVMLLKFQFGHNYQEICQITGLTYSKVAQIIHRELARLRAVLCADGEGK